ncbi:hypothetical protein Tco_0613762 [Tanacetum coccineum]
MSSASSTDTYKSRSEIRFCSPCAGHSEQWNEVCLIRLEVPAVVIVLRIRCDFLFRPSRTTISTRFPTRPRGDVDDYDPEGGSEEDSEEEHVDYPADGGDDDDDDDDDDDNDDDTDNEDEEPFEEEEEEGHLAPGSDLLDVLCSFSQRCRGALEADELYTPHHSHPAYRTTDRISIRP